MREAVGQRADAVERRADLLAQHDPAVRVEPAVGDARRLSSAAGRRRRSTVTASLCAMRNSHGRTTISRSRRAQGDERLRHRLLHRVAGVLLVADDRAAVRLQARRVAAVEDGERVVVALPRAAGERLVAAPAAPRRAATRRRGGRERGARRDGGWRHRRSSRSWPGAADRPAAR